MRQRVTTLIVMTQCLTGASLASAQPQVDILHTFVDSRDGCGASRLTESMDGRLYGTTSGCGPFSSGTIFQIDRSGGFSVLHHFAGGTADGAEPQAPVIQASDGALYGTTLHGGQHGYGTVFRVAPDGTYAVLHAFNGEDGRWSSSPLVEAGDGSFHGMTWTTVFRMTRAGQVTVLHAFQGGPTDGYGGTGALVPVGGGAFHGVTQWGGQASGTIFRMEPTGTVTVLQHLDNVDGDYSPVPIWEPIPGSDSHAYVTTPADQKGRRGELFRVTSGGAVTLLRLFPPFSSDFPTQPLVQAPDGSLYGVFVYYDATGGRVTLFGRMPANGSVERLARFDQLGLAGGLRWPPFLRGRDGHFYGVAEIGSPTGNVAVAYRLRVFPDAPSRVVGTPLAGRVRVTWAPVAGAVSYTLKRGVAPGTETPFATGLTTPAFLDGLVEPGRRYYYVVTAVNAYGESVASVEIAVTAGSGVTADFTGDGQSDLLVYRPSTHQWFVRDGLGSGGATRAIAWGADGDVPVVGDLDGDGRMELVMFRPPTAHWHVLYSSTGYRVGSGAVFQFGAPGDVPLAADFDGDGRMDLTVYQPATGFWTFCTSASAYRECRGYRWGIPGDVPLVADFDGDGRTDLTVFRPASSTWVIAFSGTAYQTWAASVGGIAGDVPLAGDFDGDGRTDLTTYRPSTGQWSLVYSTKGWRQADTFYWGAAGDRPIVGDFDGDGRSDPTVYRPGTGQWFVLLSSYQFTASASTFWGATGDVPLP
jgi:uncharacterized repeat protein (TIGR03803 family)